MFLKNQEIVKNVDFAVSFNSHIRILDKIYRSKNSENRLGFKWAKFLGLRSIEFSKNLCLENFHKGIN